MRAHRRPSKVIANNGPLAVAARGGEILEAVTPTIDARAFKPWSRKQPAYLKWLRESLTDTRCQCPDGRCRRQGEQMHHELRGAHKDDRAVLWLSRYCHHDVRHNHGCHEAYATGCRAVAADNWLSFLDSLEAA